MNEVAKKMLTKSKNSRLEKFGKTITFLCMSLIVVVVAMILIFVAKKVYRLSLSIKSISLVFYLGALGILLQRNSEPYQ